MCGFVYTNFQPDYIDLYDVKSRGPDSEKEITNDFGYFYQSSYENHLQLVWVLQKNSRLSFLERHQYVQA